MSGKYITHIKLKQNTTRYPGRCGTILKNTFPIISKKANKAYCLKIIQYKGVCQCVCILVWMCVWVGAYSLLLEILSPRAILFPIKGKVSQLYTAQFLRNWFRDHLMTP